MAERFDAEERRLRSRASAEVGKALRWDEDLSDSALYGGLGGLTGAGVGFKSAKLNTAGALRGAAGGGLLGAAGVGGAVYARRRWERRRDRRRREFDMLGDSL